MGVYLNPGPAMLRRARASRIYVDKSGLIGYMNEIINKERLFACVSRPRRFGKTMAANMVSAYYDRTVDGAAEFAGLRIAADPSFDAERNRYDVLKVNMQEFLSMEHDAAAMIALLERLLGREVMRAYPEVDFVDPTGLPLVMADVYSQVGRQFVIVIDEWDCVMREHQSDQAGQRAYLDFLRAWLKDKPYVALCYMTGILPIKKYGTHSALNMFDEYSMIEPGKMAPWTGFTEGEVEALCAEWGRDLGECRAWYDGYRLLGALVAGDADEVAAGVERPRRCGEHHRLQRRGGPGLHARPRGLGA